MTLNTPGWYGVRLDSVSVLLILGLYAVFLTRKLFVFLSKSLPGIDATNALVLGGLPIELVTEVLRYLEWNDILRLRRVCTLNCFLYFE